MVVGSSLFPKNQECLCEWRDPMVGSARRQSVTH